MDNLFLIKFEIYLTCSKKRKYLHFFFKFMYQILSFLIVFQMTLDKALMVSLHLECIWEKA